MAKPTVYLVDDDPAIRKSLFAMIDAMGMIPKAFASGKEFLGECPLDSPGCIILDLLMPGMDGLAVLEQLSKQSAQLPVIMITGHGGVSEAVHAMKRGVIDFIEKPYQPAQLRSCIETAIQLNKDSQSSESEENETKQRIDSLTDEERQILEMITTGLPMKAIAARIGVSLRTAHSRRTDIMKTIQVNTREELIALVAKHL